MVLFLFPPGLRRVISGLSLLDWYRLLSGSSSTLEHQRLFCRRAGVRRLAGRASRRGARVLARLLRAALAASPSPTDFLARDDAPDDRLLRRDELDLSDRSGRGAARECDLAAESRAGLGDAFYSAGLSRAGTRSRLVDARSLHRWRGVHRRHADAKRTTQHPESLVGAVAGDCLGHSLRRGNPLPAPIAIARFSLADCAEPHGHGRDDVAAAALAWFGSSQWQDVVVAGGTGDAADGDAVLAVRSRPANHARTYCLADHAARAAAASGLDPPRPQRLARLRPTAVVDVGRRRTDPSWARAPLWSPRDSSPEGRLNEQISLLLNRTSAGKTA